MYVTKKETKRDTVEGLKLTETISAQQCPLCNSKFEYAVGLKKCPSDGTLLRPVLGDPFIGLTLGGKYKIESLIGVGGWGQVYLAEHIHLQKTVAVKILYSHLLENPVALRRFQSEAKTANALIHPNIVAVQAHGVMPQPYIVMEHVSGITLEARIAKDRILPFEAAAIIFERLCDAMQVAHDAGFVHRDLTPSNIMLQSPDNDPKILDFGLVQIGSQDCTRTGETVGSPPYMSPEQCTGDELDGRSDIYSLGCIFYEALTGSKCIAGDTAVICMFKHLHEVAPLITQTRPDLRFPKGLDQVVAKMLAKDTADRYQTMRAVQQDLELVRTGTVKSKIYSIKRRNKKLIAVIKTSIRWGIVIEIIILLYYAVVNWISSHG